MPEVQQQPSRWELPKMSGSEPTPLLVLPRSVVFPRSGFLTRRPLWDYPLLLRRDRSRIFLSLGRSHWRYYHGFLSRLPRHLRDLLANRSLEAEQEQRSPLTAELILLSSTGEYRLCCHATRSPLILPEILLCRGTNIHLYFPLENCAGHLCQKWRTYPGFLGAAAY